MVLPLWWPAVEGATTGVCSPFFSTALPVAWHDFSHGRRGTARHGGLRSGHGLGRHGLAVLVLGGLHPAYDLGSYGASPLALHCPHTGENLGRNGSDIDRRS